MKTSAEIFRSLEDQNRLRILALLLEVPEICVCDFMVILEMPQSTVSRQLAILKKAGWLTDRKKGLWVHYSISNQLPPLQQSLLPTIHHFLRISPTAKTDLSRFTQLKNNQCCS